MTQGIVRQDKGTLIFPDRGYSFCNCKNIWFTEWSNIDLRNRHNNESKEVLQYYLSDMGLVHKDKDNNFLVEEVFILNKGMGNNKVLVCGNAPETIKEFNRLGFVVDQEHSKWDIIWAYHIFEHMHYPLQELADFYNNLKPGGVLFIAMPDPYFINFDNPHSWEHWLLREHHIMWDMDSFCDEAEAVGFKVVYKNRNTTIKVCKDMHIILKK